MDQAATLSPIRRNLLSFPLLIALILIPIALRMFSLNVTSLMDPTEARYATIAQYMVTTGDWVTPHIPTVEGTEAYLGKPPMHFWLTGLAFAIFGENEWVARLPSFICGIFTCLIIGIIAGRLQGMVAASLSIVVLMTSAIFFFFSGASIVDITLTGFITMAVGAYMLRIFGNQKNNTWYEMLLFAAMAGGFLTKGPIAIVLSGFPALLFAVWQRKFEYLKPFFSLKAIGFFVLLVAPWFILSEIRNPGFLKYFLVNENFGRYFLKDYGDRYGVGHRHVLGAIWFMLLLASLPWGLLLIPIVKNKLYKDRPIFNSPPFKFVLCWLLATPIFFTFVKQLHIGYIMPALPPFALALGCLVYDRQEKLYAWVKPLLLGLVVSLPVGSMVGIFWGARLYDLLVAIVLFAISYLLIRLSSRFPAYALLNAGLTFSLLWAAIIFGVTPFIDSRNSANALFREVAKESPPGDILLGVVRARDYSPWYYAGVSETEYGRKITLVGLKPESVDPRVTSIILRAGEERLLMEEISRNYSRKSREGGWIWYVKNPESATVATSEGALPTGQIQPAPVPTISAETAAEESQVQAPSVAEVPAISTP